jgi:hypothetical protein
MEIRPDRMPWDRHQRLPWVTAECRLVLLRLKVARCRRLVGPVFVHTLGLDFPRKPPPPVGWRRGPAQPFRSNEEITASRHLWIMPDDAGALRQNDSGPGYCCPAGRRSYSAISDGSLDMARPPGERRTVGGRCMICTMDHPYM